MNTDADKLDYGPQNPKDSPFTARMRFHQSWYRAAVLQLPYGTGPKPTSKSPLGSMLTNDNGFKNGRNFLSPPIFLITQRRVAQLKGLIDSFRLYCNMLSAQAFGFNLFAPLVDDRELAAKLIQALSEDEIGTVDRVTLSYTPQPLSEYLNDLTRFDAFIEYSRPDGSRAFIGIETRLTDVKVEKPFSNPRYAALTQQPGSPWIEGALNDLMDVHTNPIWRSHLLSESILRHPENRYASGRFLLLHHPGDSETSAAVESYRAQLKPGQTTFSSIALDELLEKWREPARSERMEEWVDKLQQRYAELALSEWAYQQSAQRDTRQEKTPGD